MSQVPSTGPTMSPTPLDGKRFLMIKDSKESTSPPPQLVVELNWLEQLKRLVPTK